MARSFALDEEQEAKAVTWIAGHVAQAHGGRVHAGAIGGAFSYIFTPTDLFMGVTVRCNLCGAKHGLSSESLTGL